MNVEVTSPVFASKRLEKTHAMRVEGSVCFMAVLNTSCFIHDDTISNNFTYRLYDICHSISSLPTPESRALLALNNAIECLK